MNKIQNDNRLSQFNSQQKADYLRSVDDTKLGKNLAKRALNYEDIDDIVIKEIDNLSKNIDQLKDVDSTNHPASFYSTCSTIESLKEIKNLVDDPLFKELEIGDILKLFNVVGIACNGKIGEYPDPSLYLVNNLFPGCYISIADIGTAEEYSKGEKHLEVPGTKEEINNCIPVFPDEKLYNFLNKNAPTIMNLLAGIGMRRVLGDIPLTLESIVLSGLWKMINILRVKKSEININCFLDICNSMKYICGKKYNDVIKIIKEQLKDKNQKNGLFINNYGLFQMLPVLYTCAKDLIFKKTELQKIFRAILRFEVYKIIRSKIRKAENKGETIKKSLHEVLGIDFEKYGTKLPELSHKSIEPKFHDEYHINKDVIKEYLKKIGWTELIPFSYILFSYSLDPSKDPIDNLKEVKEYKFENIKEELGIKYDFDLFIIFNIVQSLVYRDKIDRENENEQIMKILDSNDEKEIDKFLRAQVKDIYASEYNKQNQQQIKKQYDIISNELVELLISSKSISDFNNLMRNGITKGYLTHKIANDSTKGYIDLKKKLLDEHIEIPLRYEKLKSIISGKDEKGEILWNNGNAIRTNRKDYQIFIQKNNPQLWEEISKVNLEHNYREKVNRQGHSNSKKSYWSLGYETLQDFYEMSKKEDIKKYKELHNNCCGLGDIKKSLKNLKKIERKNKRKEYRQKKKESSKKDKKEKDNKDKGRIYRRRGRGRGGRFPKMEVDEDEKRNKENSNLENEEAENEEISKDIDYPIIGRKKKRNVKGKKNEKEDKKLIKKIKESKVSKK